MLLVWGVPWPAFLGGVPVRVTGRFPAYDRHQLVGPFPRLIGRRRRPPFAAAAKSRLHVGRDQHRTCPHNLVIFVTCTERHAAGCVQGLVTDQVPVCQLTPTADDGSQACQKRLAATRVCVIRFNTRIYWTVMPIFLLPAWFQTILPPVNLGSRASLHRPVRSQPGWDRRRRRRFLASSRLPCGTRTQGNQAGEGTCR